MYIEYRHKAGVEQDALEEERVLNRLTPHLRRDILQCIYSNAVEKFSFISSFSNATR
jgi:hypothetical protein